MSHTRGTRARTCWQAATGSALYSEFEHPDGKHGAMYAVFGSGLAYFMDCRSEDRPEDDWLSIVESVEFLPAAE